MIECGHHSAGEIAWLDALAVKHERWRLTLTRRYVCVDCGSELVLLPGVDEDTVECLDGVPVCCEWQMVDLLPDELVAPRG